MYKKTKMIWNKMMIILSSRQKKHAIILIFLSLIGAIVETLGVSAILPFVQVMTEPQKLIENKIISQSFPQMRFLSQQNLLFLMVWVLIAVYILKNIYLCFLAYYRVKFSAKVQQELSLLMFNSYINRGYIFFKGTNTAELLRGIGDSISGVYNFLYNITKLCAEVLTVVCIAGFILYTDWKLAVNVVLLVGVCLILILSILKNIVQSAGKMHFHYCAEVNKWALQLFSGIKEVLVLHREEYFVNNYEKAYEKRQSGLIKQNVAVESPAYVIEGACITGLVIAVFFRIRGMNSPADYIPQLASFAVAAFRVLPSVGRITSSVNTCIFNMPSIDEVYKNVVEASKYVEENRENEKIKREKIEYSNSFSVNNIVWQYPDGKEKILDGINIKIKKGNSIALIGPSGAGKSTLADIILGLLSPQEGNIFVDSINISEDYDCSELISFVPQSVYLLDDTIRRNIAFGLDDKFIDDNSIWDALEKTQMKNYVEKLPEQLDTVVGERGVRFSGGQVQRLAIARALYTKPEILVLDEATSALDGETEAAVMEAIEALQGKITLIIIAHRLTTIKNCDKIYEINNGKAIERTYGELI